MDHAAQLVEARVEAGHWWFRGRRRMLARLIGALDLPARATALDVGTGTGANLRLLRELGFARVQGVDRSEIAIEWCREKGLGEVERGDAAELPFADATFDLVLAADVIEHVDDDAGTVAELCRVLRPGGTLIVTVPAFPSLWGLQDDVSHHKRRYRMSGLRALLASAGLEVVRDFHFNYLLFAPIWAVRQLLRVGRVKLASENELNTPLLNALFEWIFAFDVRTAPHLRPPFGVSILAQARRTAAGGDRR